MRTISFIFVILCLPAVFGEGEVVQQNSTNNERIIAGYSTFIEYYYWQISLQDSGFHICGGSIITSYYVLTAAHCLYGTAPQTVLSTYAIKAGSSYQSYVNQARGISTYVIHPNYRGYPWDWDIALIQVSVPFVWTNVVKPIEMTYYEPGDGTSYFLSGWGQTTNWNTATPNQLQATTLYVQSRQICFQQWGTMFTDRMICALGYGTDVCRGDSGGPGVIYDPTRNIYALAGIVSYGQIPCASGKPSVYTNVAYMRPWIRYYTGF